MFSRLIPSLQNPSYASDRSSDRESIWSAILCNSIDDTLYVEVYHEIFKGLYTSIWIMKGLAHMVKETISSTYSDNSKSPNLTLGISLQIAETNLCFLNTLL